MAIYFYRVSQIFELDMFETSAVKDFTNGALIDCKIAAKKHYYNLLEDFKNSEFFEEIAYPPEPDLINKAGIRIVLLLVEYNGFDEDWNDDIDNQIEYPLLGIGHKLMLENEKIELSILKAKGYTFNLNKNSYCKEFNFHVLDSEIIFENNVMNFSIHNEVEKFKTSNISGLDFMLGPKETGKKILGVHIKSSWKTIGITYKDYPKYDVEWLLEGDEKYNNVEYFIFKGSSQSPLFFYDAKIGIEKNIFLDRLANLITQKPDFFSLEDAKLTIGLEKSILNLAILTS